MASNFALPEFISRWQGSSLTERSAAQSHFIELCRILGERTPAEADSTGAFYTFEKGVEKTSGGGGFADVWKRGYFAWEYKGRHKDLTAAYRQLLTYREDLENPPLLVVCDLDRVQVHTNFTGTAKRIYDFTLADLASPTPLPGIAFSALDVLRALFTDPSRLRPKQTSAHVTEAAAQEFAKLAQSLREAGVHPEEAAHFLVRLLFCLFAEDMGLLPARLFSMLVESTRRRPDEFTRRIQSLFEAMATGGFFGPYDIAYFNGGLFANSSALDLKTADLDILARACQLDWASVEPAIFGTLFERSLDPTKRTQLGAHYTSRDDILLIVEPVLMAPLRRRWDDVKQQARDLIAKRDAFSATPANRAARQRHQQSLEKLLTGFSIELASLRILDPACGSGNFLYVGLKQLMDLEKSVITFAAMSGLSGFFPQVSPEQLYGLEVNAYARELAQVVVWIGYIQWLYDNGFGIPSAPILKPLVNFQHMDAILTYDGQNRPVEPAWPTADITIGNPPFLGGNKIRQELGDAYVEALFSLYQGRIPAFADLVCYWFERAREQIATGRTKRVGLLATQGIRGGANRKVLESIKASGGIFWAQSDRNWILDGATVHVSMVGFDDGSETAKMLDGQLVSKINSNLTTLANLPAAQLLAENFHISYQGPSPKGAFDIDQNIAERMLGLRNINGRPNTDVVRPVVSAIDLVQRSRRKWTIDFGLLPIDQAAEYEVPFQYVRDHVFPTRSQNRRAAYAEKFWQYAEARPGMREALKKRSRFIATPRVLKHRIFVWLTSEFLANDGTIVFAREDDFFFGVLQSRSHELWARGTGTQLREAESGFRYTPTSTFETFPFPWPTGHEPVGDPRVEAIARAAHDLVEKRDRWLNPPGVTEDELKKRTLTNLYNARPTWLDLAHRELDRAVFAAYGWPDDLSDEAILERLLTLNLERAAKTSSIVGAV